MGWFDDKPADAARPISFEAKPNATAVKAVDFVELAIERGAMPDELPVGLAEFTSSASNDLPSAAKWREHDLEEAKKLAYEAGFEDGRATAEAVIEEMGEEFKANALALVRQIEQLEQNATRQIGAVAAALARVFAENILRTRLAHDDELVVSMGADVIRRACGFEQVHLYAHPELAATLQRRRFDLRPEDPVGDSVRIHPDDALGFGDIRLVADGAQVVATLDERLERLVEAARMELDNAPGAVIDDLEGLDD